MNQIMRSGQTLHFERAAGTSVSCELDVNMPLVRPCAAHYRIAGKQLTCAVEEVLRAKLQSAQSPLSAATIANFPSSFSTRRTVRGDAPRATIAIMASATRSSQRQKPVPDRLDRFQCNPGVEGAGRGLPSIDRRRGDSRHGPRLRNELLVIKECQGGLVQCRRKHAARRRCGSRNARRLRPKTNRAHYLARWG